MVGLLLGKREDVTVACVEGDERVLSRYGLTQRLTSCILLAACVQGIWTSSGGTMPQAECMQKWCGFCRLEELEGLS